MFSSNDHPQSAHQDPSPLKLIGQSPAMDQLRGMIDKVSKRASTVLIQGQSGTGKELVARQVHRVSPRHHKPFIAVDCTTIRDTLFESQLFGHVKGAFTGADQNTLGFLRSADGGTVFLDEIGELDLTLQAKLLRFIQEKALVPLGGVKPVSVDARIIAATHRDLRAMVRQGKFREDLYYRLNVVRLEVPPLDDRREDILPLAEHFIRRLAHLYDEPTKSIAEDAAHALTQYPWPGNVRELGNTIEHAYVLSGSNTIQPDDLPSFLQTGPSCFADNQEGPAILPLEVAERALIERALRATGGHQGQAATILMIDRRRLYRKVRRYGLEHCTHPHS